MEYTFQLDSLDLVGMWKCLRRKEDIYLVGLPVVTGGLAVDTESKNNSMK